MKKSSTQAAFPILLICVFIIVFVPSASGLLSNLGSLIITELTSTRLSSLHGVSSGVYITPEPADSECDWRYGYPHKMHWPQLPDFGTAGMDVDASQAILADDFKCTATGPINDIHFWASFENDILPANGANSLSFEIKIYSDKPASANSWSSPESILWSRIFNPGDYTVRQIRNRLSDWFDPLMLVNSADNHRQAFQYNFCVKNNPFIQEEGTIYWLSIREIRSENAIHKLGWKTTTKKLRWNDNAVYSVPGAAAWLPMYYPKAHEYEGQSINLAFSITDGLQGDRMHDLGDAPDSSNTFPGVTMTAYDANTTAHYPTVFWTNFPPFGPIHWQPEKWFYLGKDVSFESGADSGYDEDTNNNLYPPGNMANRDGSDDGIKLPLVLPHCQQAKIPFTVTFVSPTGSTPIYLNVWCDWNRDGDWDDTMTCPDGKNAPEWAVQNASIINNFAGTVDLETNSFMCWHPQTGDEPDPMWLRITLSEKTWSTSYPSLIGSSGCGPDEGYEYGETEDYLIYAKEDPNSTQYDWADAPDSYSYPAYPTISTNNGAYHVITGPWLGDANDKPDAELNGQPDANALGDDLDTEPLFSLGSTIDDENGVTIPPLIPGYPADITLEVGGGGGVVQAWIDYNSDMGWQPEEEVYNNFLSPGLHVISFIVPDDAITGQSFARFRISRDGNLAPDGPARDGEVEDYEVLIDSLSPYTKWLQLPDVTPHGIDIQVDSNDGMRIIADDFECTNTDKITDVHFWGSWKNDKKYDIERIHLSIYNDVPADSSNPYSQPAAKVLWQKDFYPGEFTEKLYHEVRKPGEWWWDPVKNNLVEGADKQIWKIDIDINPNEAFTQQGTADNPRIYWLAIRVDTNDGEFGWKTRRWPDHYMDDAVWDVGSELPRLWKELRYPKKHPYHDIERNSVDMAFQLTYTQDQGIPTMRPVSLTQCPAIQTKCPAAATACPPVNTRCPAAATKCPPVQTQCMAITVCQGSSETICPAVLTQCPVIETQCPAAVTQCVAITVCQGSSETICPAVLTQCPVVETECPPVETQCPVVETKCPFVETKCYAITVCGGSSETICPALQTQCPVVETECPPTTSICPPVLTQCTAVDTLCPPVETQCPPEQCQVETVYPAAETKCPVEQTKCPAVVTRCPPIETRCPPVDTECPVVETECPANETYCPVYQTYCPPVDTRCPPIETYCPPIDTKCPPVETGCPSPPTECLIIATECPQEPTRCPPIETQCPPEPTLCQVIATQCPVETVCPAAETKCPAEQTKCPVETTKCPVYETRCPTIDTQCPMNQTYCPPVETECPPADTKCPPVETQCPPEQCQVETVYPAVETKCPPVQTRCPVVETECPPVETKCPDGPTYCPIVITQCPRYETWCTQVETQCPYDQTKCPPPNPTGSCDPPPIPPWEIKGSDLMIYSDLSITEEAKRTIAVPVIQACPAIEVICPTIINKENLLVKI
ncbi:MAG: hypothetical protein JW787_01435 [Sedimentisphaerales bacterium]|nr:hypothetical protein [Sedimentisphaerales bacterium]